MKTDFLWRYKRSVNTMTNRKHHVKNKQITTLSGWFHSSLRVGGTCYYFWSQWFLYSDISYPNDFGSIKWRYRFRNRKYHLPFGSYTRDRIGSDVCLNNIYELGSKLCELLSTLKKNREYVPLEILQTQYRVPYETLKSKLVIQRQLL